MADDVLDPPVRKKPGRKPRPALPPTVEGMTPAQMLDAMKMLAEAMRGNKEADTEIAAEIHAKAMKKALRPENEVYPQVSVYNPLGERDHPRQKPTHIYQMGPYPIADPGNYDTVTATEIALLNALKPGDFTVTKADGTTVKVSVRTEYEGDGTKPRRTWLHMPIANDEQKESWPPLVQVLTEITTGETPAQSYARYAKLLAEKDAEIAALRAKASAA